LAVPNARDGNLNASQTSLALEFAKIFQLALDLRIATHEQVAFLLIDATSTSSATALPSDTDATAGASPAASSSPSPIASASSAAATAGSSSSLPMPTPTSPLASASPSTAAGGISALASMGKSSSKVKRRGVKNLGSLMAAFVQMPVELNMNWSEIFHYRMVEAQNVLSDCHVDMIHQLATTYLQSLGTDDKRLLHLTRAVEVCTTTTTTIPYCSAESTCCLLLGCRLTD
jgi:hypothetical protein